ncbi:slo-interacting protein 1 isoform X2 [Drosophila bipectinata]|uniref:slo-interacting protein 1 isoform X2 n=1 Tax=Drosophila bipectinata TaxID=42026 RepID=UPI001C8AE5FF|nr:slo-interacting protein 1 isoform X2 [Drosophila bipectinata]
MTSTFDVLDYEYVVLKINGYDISNLSRCEAVQMFLQAKETIVVEICRQKNNALEKNVNLSGAENILKILPAEERQNVNTNFISRSPTESSSITCASKNVNLNPIMDAERAQEEKKKQQIILTFRDLSINETSVCPSVFFASKETQTYDNDTSSKGDLERTITDHLIEQEHNLFEQCLEPEIDIEEITLNKPMDVASSGQIGLHVCSTGFSSSNINQEKDDFFSTESDIFEDVFICGIKSDSIAHRDGRLRKGDQILRINGIDVRSKEDAERYIAEKKSTVTLLVSRILYAEDDEDDIESNFEYDNSFLSDDYKNVVDKLDKVLLSQVKSKNTLSNNQPVPHSKCLDLEKKKNADENIKFSNNSRPVSNKKKYFNRSTNKNQGNLSYEYDENEHIYETIPEDFESEPLYCSPYQSSNYMMAVGSCSPATITAPIEIETDVLKTAMQQQTQRVAQWLGLKSQCSKPIQNVDQPKATTSGQLPECNRIFTLRSTMTCTSRSSSSGVVYSLNRPSNIPYEKVDNCLSAYSTSDSYNRAPPYINTLNAVDETILNSKLDDIDHAVDSAVSQSAAFLTSPLSSMLLLPFGKSGRIGLCSANLDTAYITETHSKTCKEEDVNIPKSDEKVINIKQIEESHCRQFNAPNLSRYHFVANKVQDTISSTNAPELIKLKDGDEKSMVWKVKRRADGSRYIVKRPVRNRTLQKNIRGCELATEEETISEVKIGRYWTKDERRRHIERARDRRHHQT